jgi:hypothetical protein
MLKNFNLFYSCYLFCIILCACLSSESLGNLKYLPLLFLFVYAFLVFITDFGGLIDAIKETKYVGIFIAFMLLGIVRSNIPHQTSYQLLGNFFYTLLFYLTTCHMLKYLANRNDTKRILKTLHFIWLGLSNRLL